MAQEATRRKAAMSPKSMFEPEHPGARRSAVMTRIFDLLLVGGYLTCAVLTYMLFFEDTLPSPERLAAARAPVVATAPTATPAPTVDPETTPTPEPVKPPVSKDLIVATSEYVEAVSTGQIGKARAMRGDPSVPSVENMKRVTKMEMLTIVPYPRLGRSKGSVYVELRITKDQRTYTWRGRIDWERRQGKWMTTDWDSTAAAPGSAASAVPAGG
jgi:hypothetical protein